MVHGVVGTPEHLRGRWSDGAELQPVPGGTGAVTFGDRPAPDAKVAPPRFCTRSRGGAGASPPESVR
ncbi:hypothetical protein Kpho02_55190 [Kitasatospora phosalacinea]|uniref:Uncharacterized protein n=1 Tax=Kitasatospora phosalacinea TaxID=2065 RepID=A0A9W6V5K1_9ACTN|nr:hypothetical protein Kpho02_55190 [Kitasatospora phosalacinea]